MRWLSSWLIGQTQSVVVNGVTCAWQGVTLGVPEGSILGREALDIDVEKLEGWAMSNSMKFNKGNWRIPHLRQGNPGSMSRLGEERLENDPA